MAGEVVVDDHTMVGRALAVIEAVAAHGPPIALAELSSLTGNPKPTTHRIVNDLVTRWSCAAALLPSTTGNLAVIGVNLEVGRANSREVLRALLRALTTIAAERGPPSEESGPASS
jgi:hypothetical protein